MAEKKEEEEKRIVKDGDITPEPIHLENSECSLFIALEAKSIFLMSS